MVFFAGPFPMVRVPARVEAFLSLDAYEALTPLVSGSRAAERKVERDQRQRVRWAWKRQTDPLTARELLQAVQSGLLRREEVPFQLRDRDTGTPILVNAGSVYWNAYRRRYVMIAEQLFGSSVLGEIWYAEADTPVGPWGYAVKIVTHEKYSFYNPKQHPMFDKHGGRVIFFEGTYSTFLSGAPFPTPRYNYNQIMYRLDLSDPRVAVPVPVYDVSEARDQTQLRARLPLVRGDRGGRVVFFAPDRPFPGGRPVVVQQGRLRVLDRAEHPEAVFYVLVEPPHGERPIVPLYEYAPQADGPYRYGTSAAAPPGYARETKPLGYVWQRPYETALLDEVLSEYEVAP